ncbi:MAG: hypothetical protein KKA10_03925 [Euryarchaeota archaeon]|nr:hypothetical protein [Euryarchaeota archaeon]MCG2736405.1 hypothetical protein [Candidatus Methanoperedenaceae archaeon]
MINSFRKYQEPQIKAPRVAPLEGASTYAPAGAYVSMHCGGHDADERRLNVLFLDIIGMAFEKEREGVLNMRRVMGKDKNQYGIKRNPLALIKDKFSATNLRLSAFICGLKFDNTRQLYIISNVERRVLLFVNHSKRVI